MPETGSSVETETWVSDVAVGRETPSPLVAVFETETWVSDVAVGGETPSPLVAVFLRVPFPLLALPLSLPLLRPLPDGAVGRKTPSPLVAVFETENWVSDVAVGGETPSPLVAVFETEIGFPMSPSGERHHRHW
jgi:hypothetical protein